MLRTVTFLGLVFFRLALQVACYAASGRQLQQYDIDSTSVCQVFHFDEDGDVNATSRRFLYPPCPTISLFEAALYSGITTCKNQSASEGKGALIDALSLTRLTLLPILPDFPARTLPCTGRVSLHRPSLALRPADSRSPHLPRQVSRRSRPLSGTCALSTPRCPHP